MKIFYINRTLILFVLIASLIYIPSSNAKQEDDAKITQGEFAILLVRAMGIEEQLTRGPLINDYIALLENSGISPLEGWNPSKLLTRGAMSVMLVRAMGLENEVEADIVEGYKIRGVEKYIELLAKKKIHIAGSAEEVLASRQVMKILRSPIFRLPAARPYLVPATPTLPGHDE